MMKPACPQLNAERFRAETIIQIPFHDIDSIEVAWHGHYFKYLEIAREQLLSQLDYGYRAMRDYGHAWPIIEARIKYPRPLVFEQRIRVVAQLLEYENRLKIGYQIYDLTTGERTTSAWTIQVAVDRETGAMLFRSPDILFLKMGISQ